MDTPKKMIERREREKGRRRDIEREGEIREGGRDKREREREVKGIKRERVKGRGIERERVKGRR